MKRLEELLEGLDIIKITGDTKVEVSDIVNDSRKVTDHSLFFCISGAAFDGHNFAREVVEKGAKVLVVE